MKVVSLVLVMSVFLFLTGCGQYGGLYLPNTKKTVSVTKKAEKAEKAEENPLSTESVVESDTPP